MFAVMALSNAIVPVLPSYTDSSAAQAAIYSAYFLGAFISTLPAGILSDRYGRVPVIRTGVLQLLLPADFCYQFWFYLCRVIVARILEGIGTDFLLPLRCRMSIHFPITNK